MDTVEQLKARFLDHIEQSQTLEDLEKVRIQALGKTGEISVLMKGLGKMPPEERKEKGQTYNSLRKDIQQALDARFKTLKEKLLEHRLQSEKLDLSLSPRPHTFGSVHPLTQAMFEAYQIFNQMGFEIAEGPDIEDDEHNFNALNIPETHPARQDHDTFYFPPDEKGERLVLRTHTSPVQIRTLRTRKPPLKVICPGRVFRSDSDQTHTPNFHQIEGFVIDKHTHMGHLKGCLTEFWRRFFGMPNLPVRFRPSYFPFTEPSAEVDIGCKREKDKTVIGAGEDWLEILGCGMIHPQVLRNCGLDPDEYQGFAFGMGVERLAMLKYGIPDLRAFYEGDLRWLRHFGFSIIHALNAGALS